MADSTVSFFAAENGSNFCFLRRERCENGQDANIYNMRIIIPLFSECLLYVLYDVQLKDTPDREWDADPFISKAVVNKSEYTK